MSSSSHGRPAVVSAGVAAGSTLSNLDHNDPQASNSRHHVESLTHNEPTQTVGSAAPEFAQTEVALPDRSHIFRKVLTFFGIGRNASRARKSLVSMLWNLVWGFIQFVAVIVLLFLAKFLLVSPRNPGVSEWDTCDRLGILAAFWLIRVSLASTLAYWEYRRDRRLHFPNGSDVEALTPAAADTNQPQVAQQTSAAAVDPLSLPYTHLYSRLTLFSSLVTFVWFIMGNILVYNSFNTCRLDAPHLWYLNIAILGILYLMVLEVVVLGFVVLIVAPILFIFWNIFLICIGRHPMQNPNAIKPEIGKLPKAIVDRIPLVNYIPAPPTDTDDVAKETPPLPHIYPPKPKKQQMRFRLLQTLPFIGSKSSKAKTSGKQTENESDKSDSWADNWEQGQYPFITLDGNRATCAICLNDFEEPPRKGSPEEQPSEEAGNTASKEDAAPKASTFKQAVVGQESNTSDELQVEPLKLPDASAGPQPLRLLGCAHVFHKSCIDPWLTNMSGRCPVCQRPIEPSKPHKSRRI